MLFSVRHGKIKWTHYLHIQENYPHLKEQNQKYEGNNMKLL